MHCYIKGDPKKQNKTKQKNSEEWLPKCYQECSISDDALWDRSFLFLNGSLH
jgi:hypothetical protein